MTLDILTHCMSRSKSNETENSTKSKNSNENNHGNRIFSSMFLENFWAFVLILKVFSDNMLPNKLFKICSIIVDFFLINSYNFLANIQFDSMSFT